MKYTTIKCRLKDICKNEEVENKLFEICVRTHFIVIHTYQFLRLWILDLYHKKKEIPLLDDTIINIAIKAICAPTAGAPVTVNKEIYEEFQKFYEDTYKKLISHQLKYLTKTNNTGRINCNKLSQIRHFISKDIIQNIQNNVEQHYITYIKRFVNTIMKPYIKEILLQERFKKNEILKKQKEKKLYNELQLIKDDFLNNTLNSHKRFHSFIKQHRSNIIFDNFNEEKLKINIKIEPQKYLKGMIYMSLFLENKGLKTFQFFPLRTNKVVKYVQFDTITFTEVLYEQNLNSTNTMFHLTQNALRNKVEQYKNSIWNEYFNLEHPIFKSKGKNFDYTIKTDGYAVSIQFVKDEDYDKNIENKKKKTEGRKKNYQETKNMTINEKIDYKNNKKTQKKTKREESIKKLKEENKNTIIDTNIKYLEDLNDNEFTELKKSKWVVIDPGKRTLLYMKMKEEFNNENKKIYKPRKKGKVIKKYKSIPKNKRNNIDKFTQPQKIISSVKKRIKKSYGITLRYNNRTHVTRTKRLKYTKIIQKYKDKRNISIYEMELSEYNSKSCNFDEFKEYVKITNEYNCKLLKKYEDRIFRQYKWYSYLNRQKVYAKLIRDIKNKFGDDVILIIGDWSTNTSNKKMIQYMSTPDKKIKEKLQEHFKLYYLDEYNTSKINYHTEKENNDNFYYLDRKNKLRKLHSVLTYKTESQRLGCINRDENASRNMIKIVDYFLTYRKRHPIFEKRSIPLGEDTHQLVRRS